MDAGEAIFATLRSPNVADENSEPANLVDVIHCVATGLDGVANAITPRIAAAGRDAAGGHVESLTEAVMGVTAAASQIAYAINDLAEAVRETRSGDIQPCHARHVRGPVDEQDEITNGPEGSSNDGLLRLSFASAYGGPEIGLQRRLLYAIGIEAGTEIAHAIDGCAWFNAELRG